MDQGSSGNWGDYSRLVLDQLKNLNSSMDRLTVDFGEVKKDLIYIKAREDKIVDLIEWKKEMEKIAQPKTLSDALKELEDLKRFRTTSVAIFGTIQFIMAVAMLASRFI